MRAHTHTYTHSQFQLLDADGDGMIDSVEFRKLLDGSLSNRHIDQTNYGNLGSDVGSEEDEGWPVGEDGPSFNRRGSFRESRQQQPEMIRHGPPSTDLEFQPVIMYMARSEIEASTYEDPHSHPVGKWLTLRKLSRSPISRNCTH